MSESQNSRFSFSNGNTLSSPHILLKKGKKEREKRNGDALLMRPISCPGNAEALMKTLLRKVNTDG